MRRSMTWGDWKRWMKKHGVKDNDEISYIDCHEPSKVERHTSTVRYLPHVPPEQRVDEGKIRDYGWAVW
jgi:hypothetical protein